MTTAQGSEVLPTSRSTSLVAGVLPPKSSRNTVTRPAVRLAATAYLSSAVMATALPCVGSLRAAAAGAPPSGEGIIGCPVAPPVPIPPPLPPGCPPAPPLSPGRPLLTIGAAHERQGHESRSPAHPVRSSSHERLLGRPQTAPNVPPGKRAGL